MDDKDQTQMDQKDASVGQTRSRSRRKAPAGQPAPDQQPISPAQTSDLLANQMQDAHTTGSLADQTQQVQPRLTRQLIQPQLPQPILFLDREGDVLLEEDVVLVPARRQRLRRTRRWLRSRSGRVVIPLLALLIGLAIGLTSVIWYGLSGEGPLVAVLPAAQGNLVVDANKDFVSQLVLSNLANAGIPGHMQNVTVTLKHGALIVIQGEDVYPIFFTSITKPFTVDVQPYTHNCILQVRITHADFSGIPVTSFVQSFQSKINQQLAEKPTGLPNGFTYCTVGVSTEPGGMYITYQATPVTH
ncbi:MAG TPA: hypothetical protein VGM01_05925 [Ktedonobacteraceae bacterium]